MIDVLRLLFSERLLVFLELADSNRLTAHWASLELSGVLKEICTYY
jgi:hypothetical protein